MITHKSNALTRTHVQENFITTIVNLGGTHHEAYEGSFFS